MGMSLAFLVDPSLSRYSRQGTNICYFSSQISKESGRRSYVQGRFLWLCQHWRWPTKATCNYGWPRATTRRHWDVTLLCLLSYTRSGAWLRYECEIRCRLVFSKLPSVCRTKACSVPRSPYACTGVWPRHMIMQVILCLVPRLKSKQWSRFG